MEKILTLSGLRGSFYKLHTQFLLELAYKEQKLERIKDILYFCIKQTHKRNCSYGSSTKSLHLNQPKKVVSQHGKKSFKNRTRAFSLVTAHLTGYQLYNSETIQGKTLTLQQTNPHQVLKSYSYIYGLQTFIRYIIRCQGLKKNKREIEIMC